MNMISPISSQNSQSDFTDPPIELGKGIYIALIGCAITLLFGAYWAASGQYFGAPSIAQATLFSIKLPTLGVMLIILSGTLMICASFWALKHLVKIQRNFDSLLLQLSKERSRFKLEVEQLEKEAEEARQETYAKAQFIAMMSHDVRTPLNAIVGLTDLLRRTQIDDEQGNYLETIGKACDSLLSLINNIMDVSRFELGNMDVENLIFSPCELMDEVGEITSVLAKAQGNRLSLNIDDNVPAYVVGDVGRLRQVLLNLAGNACKFTRAGLVELKLLVKECNDDCISLCFEVRDNGLGMNEQLSGRIFDMFTQGDETQGKMHNASGLGLAISRRLVNAMGGGILVQSQEGKGSAFSFDLEFKVANVCLEEENEDDSLYDLHGHRVLVIDDTAANLLVTCKMMEAMGAQVFPACNGAQALEAVNLQSFDLILTDMQMPQMDGIETMNAIRQKLGGKEPPIVALTVQSFPKDREKALGAGFDGYLTKPIKYNTLLIELAHIIRASIGGLACFASNDSSIQTRNLDTGLLLEMRRELGPAVFKTIMEQLDTDAHSCVHNLQAQLKRPNCVVIAMECHKLAGILAQIGLPQQAQMARGLEIAARHQEQNLSITILCDAVHQGFTVLDRYLDKISHGLSGHRPDNAERSIVDHY